ncbi:MULTISPECIES: DUF1566 domain-containing protein [Pseudomonas]|uniref:DUF1566 domain-containing protein n=1 Tax=Pseudomonas TaxID=286 RepID=UPI00235F983E|nr:MULTISPECIES: DUF1566 domain-containing protein [Pseudomonas]WJV25869.1 DUF1566 domain-containing protein [Pseudomonas chlororaphis]
MKSEMVKLEHKGLKFKMSRPTLAEIALASVFAQASPANAPQAIAVPAIGEYWPGQGGINGGFVAPRGNVPAHYLIVADKDIGEHKWGRYGEESEAISKWDGKANTDALIAAGGHPAAEAARAYTVDGHSDFDLPAAAQLYQAWVHDLIAKGGYWSSSQRSALTAFTMGFGGGTQYSGGKSYELRVRPVRRFFI